MKTYKIVPHIGVNNTGNNRMWRTLSQMYELYDKLPSRISRDGFKITIREKDSIWFDVIFRQEKEEKTIEFYVTTSEIWGDKLKDIIENHMKVTISECEDQSKLQVPEENTTVKEIRLARHDIFSLDLDNREQTSPISSILTATDDLVEDGDLTRLSVCSETMNRKEWAKRALYAYEKLNSNKVPQRAGVTANKVTKAVSVVIMKIFETVFEVLQKTLEAAQNVFFTKDEGTSKEEINQQLNDFRYSLVNEINSSKTSNKTNQKIHQPVWKTHIRVASHTKDELRSDLIGNTISSSYGELSGDNELISVNIRGKKKKKVIKEMNTFHLSENTKFDTNPSLLSSDEMGKVSMQMPTSVVQERYETELENNEKVVTEIPSIFKNNKGLLVGHANVKDEEIPIHLPSYKANEFYRGYVFSGEMGMGKDTALQNFIVEGSINHNMSFVVVDQVNKEGREGLANGIRDSLPPEKIVDLDYSNEDYLPPLDLTEVVKKLGRKGSSRFANELIDFFGDIGDKAQSKKILRTMAKASGGNLRLTKELLESEELRRKRIDELSDKGLMLLADALEEWVIPDSLELASYYAELEQTEDSKEKEKIQEKIDKEEGKLAEKREKIQSKLESKGVAIFNRLDDFFGDDTLNAIFSQDPHPDMDFEKWMKEGKVIILRVPDRNLSTMTVRTLVHWITLKTLMTRLLMTNDEQENGTFVVYNEPQTYLDKGLAHLISRIATQGRKERLGALIAVQYFDQLGDLTNDLTGGGVNWFLFRNGSEKIYKELRNKLEPHVTIEEAMKTEKYHALNLMNFGGKQQTPFLVKMLPPSYERHEAYDNSFLTKRHARQYGRKFEEVERRIVNKIRA